MLNLFVLDENGSVYVYGSKGNRDGFFRYGRPVADYQPIDVSKVVIMDRDIPAWAIDGYVWDIAADSSVPVFAGDK